MAFHTERLGVSYLSRPSNRLIVEDSLIENCKAEAGGGALRLGWSSDDWSARKAPEAIFRNSTISGCSADFAGAIWIAASFQPDRPVDNQVAVRLHSSSIHGSRVSTTGGIYGIDSAVVEVMDSFIYDCHSTDGSGGALSVSVNAVATVQR